MSAIAPSFAELESKIIAKAKRGAKDAGDAWLALHDATQDADVDGDLETRAARRLKQRRNDECRTRRNIQHPVAFGPRDGITQKCGVDDPVPHLRRPVVDADDKSVWTREMVAASGIAGTRIKAPDADDDTDEDTRFEAAVDAARLKLKPRDRAVLACVYDERLSVKQTADRVKKTPQAIYASMKRIAVAIGGAA
jgi:DNA-directed RNA polymerase specialized sigma24 family protein